MSGAKKVGLIGVGMMGHGIAKNLLKHGHSLSFLAHPGNQPVDDLIAAGAKSEESVATLAASSEVLILCVTGSPQVEDVVMRQDGVLSGLKRGALVIDCTTAIPSSTEKIAQSIAGAGGRYLDAAMTRTSKEAEEGRLGLIVGGDAGLFKEAEPLLNCFAEAIVHAGPVGSGHKLKLLHNFVSLGFAALLAEAAAAAAHAGVDPAMFLQVLEKGAGDGVVYKRLKPYIQSGDPSGLRFTIVNALKDLTYYNQMAGDVGAPHLVAEAVRKLYGDATDAGAGDKLVPEIVAVLSEKK